MSDHQRQGKLRRVGALWKPKPGSKSAGSGSITVGGLRQRFVILRNDRKQPGDNQPDYVLMTSDDPEPDTFAAGRTRPGGGTAVDSF